MRAAIFLIRGELRRRWRSLTVVVLLVGLAGGVTLAAVAGARRTSSSFDRFLESTGTQDVLVFDDHVGRADVATVRALPGVEAVGWARFLALDGPIVRAVQGFATVGPLDEQTLREVHRTRIVAGRATAPGAAEEVVISEPLARATHLGVGDSFPVQSYTPEQTDLLTRGIEVSDPAGPEVRLHVVGISRSPEDLSLTGAAGGIFLLPRAFVEKYGERIGNYYGPTGGILLVRLDEGAAGVPRFVQQLRRVLDDGSFDVDPVAVTIGGVQESIDLLAIAVTIFAVISGVAGLLAIGMTTSRQVGEFAGAQAPARELGLSPRWRAVAAAGPVMIAVLVGAIVATLTAWAASPLFPFGVAGKAEPHPGLHADVFVLGVGVAAIVMLVGAVVGAASWRSVRVESGAVSAPVRPSAVTRLLETVGATPAATVGARMALEPGRGRSAVPVRSALAGAAVAVFGVVAVVVFSASLDHLLATPRAFGRAWDAAVVDTRGRPVDEGQRCGRYETRLLSNPAIGDVAVACSASMTIDGRAVGAVGITSLRGSIHPTVLEGRAPRRHDEVALGTDTLAALHRRLGNRVVVRLSTGPARYRVVGRVVMPQVADPQAIADGALFTGGGFDRVARPDTRDTSFELVVRFRPGVDAVAAMARIERRPGIGGPGQPGVVPAAVPLEIERVHQVARIPRALGAYVAALGAIAVGHLLVTSVRRRRRDLAVLKTMGCSRRQLMGTVAWQATTVAAVGVIVGVTLGVITGRILWRITAHRVGLPPDVDVPAYLLVVVALATVVSANLVAAIPARAAARTQPAVVLRTE